MEAIVNKITSWLSELSTLSRIMFVVSWFLGDKRYGSVVRTLELR